MARSVKIGKSESGDSVAVDRDGVVRGSVVGRVEPALITRVASALRCTQVQPRPYGSKEWDADWGASAMVSNNKKGMHNIRYPTDQYIQIGDSVLIRVEAIGGVNLVFHQPNEHGNPEDVVACVQDVIYTPWLGFNRFSIWKEAHKNSCSVNPTGTQAGRLRFIRRSANDSLYATRLPPSPLPVDVANESAPESSAYNPPMPVGAVGAPRESAFVSAACIPPPVPLSENNLVQPSRVAMASPMQLELELETALSHPITCDSSTAWIYRSQSISDEKTEEYAVQLDIFERMMQDRESEVCTGHFGPREKPFPCWQRSKASRY